MALSLKEAHQLKRRYIGTEHLLLGLIREKEGRAARVLEILNVESSEIRTLILRVLSGKAEEYTDLGSANQELEPISDGSKENDLSGSILDLPEMQGVAEYESNRGNSDIAQLLINISVEIFKINLDKAIQPNSALQFLAEALGLCIVSGMNIQIVSQFLESRLGDLNEQLLQVLQDGEFFALEGQREQLQVRASVLTLLGITFNRFLLGDRAFNLELAIATFQLVTQVCDEVFPQQWILAQNFLADIYQKRVWGDPGENLEKAIATCQTTLQVCTREAFPKQWAFTQNILAFSYTYRIQGDRADNLEHALAFCQLALQVYTREEFPDEWALTQNVLSDIYLKRIKGDRAENLELAIAACQLALQVRHHELRSQRSDENFSLRVPSSPCLRVYFQDRTREAFPTQWANNQHNLGVAYSDRIRGDRAENLELAIAAYHLTLQVHTHEEFPKEWAQTHMNLANVYRNRIKGDRADNLEQSISACQLALQVLTREGFPREWAGIQNNLAGAYVERSRGNRSDNLDLAIEACNLALQVYTRETLPERWALTQSNLAVAYNNRVWGDRAENLELAIAAHEASLQVYTREAFPLEWANAQNNLAVVYIDRIRGGRADNLEQAINACQLALQIRTRETLPVEWAMTQNNLAFAYANRIKGEHADNLERAIVAYELALQIYICEAFPNECRRTARNLGDLHFEQQAWTEAAKAYKQALAAAETIYQSCLFLGSKAIELAKTGDLSPRAAYALARTGDLQAASLTLEQGRARGLSETLNRDRANLIQLQQTRPDLYTQYQDITTQLRTFENQERLRTISDDRHDLTPEAHRTRAITLHQQLDTLLQDIRQVPGYEKFLTLPTFDDIRRAVRGDLAEPTLCERPLVYLVSTPAGSLALIVTANNIESIWLDDLTETNVIDLLDNTWFAAYDHSQRNHQGWLDAIAQVTRQLWEPLMAPLIVHLKQQKAQQATLIPTGYLSLLPLHAAWIDAPTKPTGKRYALDEILFTYAPNARSLITAGAIAQRTKAELMLAIDNPLKDLPNSSREVAAAIASFPQHRVLKHEEATATSVLAALPHCNILHLSCHGTANLDEPLNSGLAMSNGMLTLRDLLDLKLIDNNQGGIRLAVLSACETGVTGIELADEAISLPTGLLQAGVAGVVASLWSVDDLSTMMLLTRFYDLWRIEGLEIAHALRQAQQWVRDTTNGEKIAYFKDFILESSRSKMPSSTADYLYKSMILSRRDERDFAHPFHWAAFSYTGV